MQIVSLDRPTPDGCWTRAVPCPDCGDLVARQRRRAFYQEKQALIARYSQKTGRFRRQTFAAFDQRRDEEQRTVLIRKAYRAARAFAADPQGWLVLYGDPGAGKSHLAAAVANHLEAADGPEEERPLVLFLTAPDLLDLLRGGYRSGDYAELLALCREVDVLILDDLGVEQETDWAAEKLFQVLNHRYQAELPTVIVTNCRLEAFGRRLESRLQDVDLSVCIGVLAPDYRRRETEGG